MYTNIFDELFRMNREMNRIFDRAGYTGQWPETNIYEDADSYVLVAKVPGMDKSDLDITLKDNTLSIKGERKAEWNDKSKLHLAERPVGTFQRNFMLDARIDADKVKAETSNGLLVIKLPKAAEAKTRQIAIA